MARDESMSNKILIVDDDPSIREVLSLMLTDEGYETVEANNGREAVEQVFGDEDPDLIILDIMMPEMDGIEACAKIREKSTVPVLFLTAKSQDQDRMDAYSGGGDDFLIKPFERIELITKVRSIIRRRTEYDRHVVLDNPELTLLSDSITVDIKNRILYKKGERINLTDKEADIMRCFLEHRGDTVYNKDLYENVWDEPYMQTASNTIMVHVLNLRKKLKTGDDESEIIRTVWGKGYRID